MRAFLHVQPCPCSRCRVAANYRRLLATVTDAPPPVARQLFTVEDVVPALYARSRNLDLMGHTA